MLEIHQLPPLTKVTTLNIDLRDIWIIGRSSENVQIKIGIQKS